MAYYSDTMIGAEPESVHDFDPSFGLSLGAAVEDAYVSNPTKVIYDYTRIRSANQGERLNKVDAQQRVKEAGVSLKIPEDGYTKDALDMVIERKQDEANRLTILDRAPAGILPSTTRFTASLLTSILDPINVASAFIPVVGQERYAAMVANATGAWGRAGVRAGVGAIEGTVGAALVEPINLGLRTQMQDDYHMVDSLINVGFGGVMGGGLHAGGGAIKDAYRPRIGELSKASVEDVHAAQIDDAIVQADPQYNRPFKTLPSPQSLTMPDVPTIENMQAYSNIEDVPLSSAVSFQSARKWDSFNEGVHPGELIKGYGDKPVALRLETGEYVIYDGNHRTDLALNAGETSMEMHVIDVKNYDPVHAGRKRVVLSKEDDDALLAELFNEAPPMADTNKALNMAKETARRATSPDSIAAKVADTAPETRAAALRVSVAQAMEGRIPDVDAVLNADPQYNLRQWFGNSKVVDDSGQPLQVYHGTSENFDSFSSGKRGTGMGDPGGFEGTFFTKDPETASMYAGETTFNRSREDYESGMRGQVMPVYLKLENPLTVERATSRDPEVLRAAQAAGHDGVIDPRGDYVVFNPEDKVKSSIGNSGRYDPNSTSMTDSQNALTMAKETARRATSPESIAIADFPAAQAAAERLAKVPQGEDAAEKALESTMTRLDEVINNMELRGMAPEKIAEMRAALKPFDDNLKDAQKLGDAARAYVVCQL